MVYKIRMGHVIKTGKALPCTEGLRVSVPMGLMKGRRGDGERQLPQYISPIKPIVSKQRTYQQSLI